MLFSQKVGWQQRTNQYLQIQMAVGSRQNKVPGRAGTGLIPDHMRVLAT
jgi:hypothetical protein